MNPTYKKNLSRREFLKLAGLAGLSYAAPQTLSSPGKNGQQTSDTPNILIVIFDAWSALNCSLYGYPRDTTPHINRLAEQATVYHNHYSAGTWTGTGTAGLFTGALTWEHRLFGFEEFFVSDEYRAQNFFNLLPSYHRFAFTHNAKAEDVITKNFLPSIAEYIPRKNLLMSYDFFADSLFAGDNDTASIAMVRGVRETEDDYGFGYSLYFSRIQNEITSRRAFNKDDRFPLGLPGEDSGPFLLEDAMDWANGFTQKLTGPFIGYCHFLPPHAPYNTRHDFHRRFENDGFLPPDKPFHPLSTKITHEQMQTFRREYDEYILYVDAEFNRLYQMMEAAGTLDNTWVILTSDHGEMFERGERGHRSQMVFDSGVRVPLLVFEPGQAARRDIYEVTSAIDFVPTIAHITGQPAPGWGKGQILPQFVAPAGERDIFIVENEHGRRTTPMEEGSILLRRGQYKMAYYFGYQKRNIDELVELYDLETDPEELNDLSTAMPELASEMLQAIKAKLAEVNAPYL